MLRMMLPSLFLLVGMTEGSPLLGGRFQTTTDVEGILSLGLDVAAIEKSNDTSQRENLYRDGQTSHTMSSGGKRLNITLASLSLNSTGAMIQDQFFNLYRHNFETKGLTTGDKEGYFLGRPAKEYANTIVSGFFDQDLQHVQAEAILVLNVWMAAVHEMYEVLRCCREQYNVNASMVALDRAAALWIGVDQGYGSSKLGHLLYRLTEEAGQRFGQDPEETLTNKRIIERLNSIQTNLSIGINCSEESESGNMRNEVQSLINLMTVPLVQNLIHHVFSYDEDGDTEFVDLYASTVMPQIAACDANLANELYLDSIGSWDESMKLEWMGSLMNAYSCFRLTCEDIGTYALSSSFPKCDVDDQEGMNATLSMAGYIASEKDALTLSYVDRDVLQLEIYLQSEAYEAALDLYKYGYNSRLSLQDLALNKVIAKPLHALFDDFQQYYQSNGYSFADDEIQDAMGSKGDFTGASKIQISEIVVGLVKFEVMFLSIVSSLEVSVEHCWQKEQDLASQLWDMGAALYIGSIEGISTGGKNGGRSLYGDTKKLCHSFDTCEQSNLVILALSNGTDYIQNRDCQAAVKILRDSIIPALQVLLIQGSLVYGAAAAELKAGSLDGSIGTAHSFSRGILPLVHKAREDSAIVIDQNLRFASNETFIVDGMSQVASAFSLAIPGMAVGCEDVGILKSASFGNLCQVEKVPATNETVPEEVIPSSSLVSAFGRYNFTSLETADQFASIALDVRDMVQAPTLEDAALVYGKGRNAFRSSYYREKIALSLSSFSTEAASFMSEDPMFSIFKYALYDDESLENGDTGAFTYADEIVQEAIRAGAKELAAESAVVLNVWMMLAHQLYNVVRTCKDRGNAKVHVDSAAALWMGKEQSEGTFDGGWLVYSIAQTAAKQFGHEEREARVNSQIMDGFSDLQAVADKCVKHPETSLDLRIRVNDLLRVLSIPLIHRLLFSIASDDRWHVELYAAAVISQCAACSPEAHFKLSDVLYSGFSKNKVDDQVIENLALFLQCMRISCQDLNYTDEATPELQLLVSGICSKIEAAKNETSLLDIGLDTNVQEASRVDLDILQIGIFMRTGAYEAAFDYYRNGHNSQFKQITEQNLTMGSISKEQQAKQTLKGNNRNLQENTQSTSLTSLHSLASLPERFQMRHLDIFTEYYGSLQYADEIIMHCLHRTGIFRKASRMQLAEALHRTLQGMVSYMAVVWQFQVSVKECNEERTSSAIDSLKTAQAFFVGSVDASMAAASSSKYGYLLHSLSVEQCSRFNTCDKNGESTSNNALFRYFEEAKTLLREGQCADAQDLLDSRMIPLLQTPLVQGTLYYSISKDSPVQGYIFAHSILPVVDEANTQSGRTIAEAFESPFESLEVPGDTEAVFEAVKYALPRMQIECGLLGYAVDRPDLSLCLEYNLPLSVKNYSKIGLDVGEMSTALSEGQNEIAQKIYIDGKNSFDSSASGTSPKLISLQSLSTEATAQMTEEPVFNLYLHTFSQGVYGSELQESLSYADKFVQGALMSPSDSSKTLAAEAVVALNVWMYFAHMLHQVLESCETGVSDSRNVSQSIHEAAAYWIGDAEVGLEGGNGHLMYALADEMDGHFESTEENVLSVNQHVLSLFAEAKSQMFDPNACQSDSTTLDRLRVIVRDVEAQMTIPLVQGLIHSLRTNDRDRVRLYSHAVVPLAAACDPAGHEYFQTTLLNAEYNAVDTDSIVERVYSILPCLGLRCSQIGVHFSEMVDKEMRSRCTIFLNSTNIAGYHPAEDFYKYNQLDLDLRAIGILMQMQAYNAAEEIYLYGKYTDTSLAKLATDARREGLPQFSFFSSYFDSETYADDLVYTAVSDFDTKFTASERRIFALRFSQTLILQHGALQAIFDSSERCGTDIEMDSDAIVSLWDQAAALLIGSLPKPKLGEPTRGYAPYDLAQEHCSQFGTCNDDGIAVSNERMIELFYAGRGAVSGGSCGAIRKIGEEIRSLLLVPVIQATLSSSLKLSQSGHSRDDITEAYVFSQAVIPLIYDVDSSIATTIQDSLTLDGASFNKRTARMIFASFAEVYEGLGVDCELVGTANGMKACDFSMPPSDPGLSTGIVGLLVCISILILVLIGLALLLSRNKKKGPKNSTNAACTVLSKFQDSTNCSSDSQTSLEKENVIQKSFRAQKKRMSPKANKVLSRIMGYGDDEETGSPAEEKPVKEETGTEPINNIKNADMI